VENLNWTAVPCSESSQRVCGKKQIRQTKKPDRAGNPFLLIEDGKKLILVDCGLGNKQDDKFFGHYSLWGDDNLDKNLKNMVL
jgi:hypothetical protein